VLSSLEATALLDRIERSTLEAIASARSQDHEEAGVWLAERAGDLARFRKVFPDLTTAPDSVQARVGRLKELDVELMTLVSRQKRELTATRRGAFSQGYREGFAPAALLSRRA